MPKLHDMKNAMRQLLDAVRADICFRTSDCQEQIQFVLDRSKKLNEIQEAIESKQIPKRVTHNDTRYSNVLIDSDSKKAICLIDLDTVMPGASILDFGDAVRAVQRHLRKMKNLAILSLIWNFFGAMCRATVMRWDGS